MSRRLDIVVLGVLGVLAGLVLAWMLQPDPGPPRAQAAALVSLPAEPAEAPSERARALVAIAGPGERVVQCPAPGPPLRASDTTLRPGPAIEDGVLTALVVDDTGVLVLGAGPHRDTRVARWSGVAQGTIGPCALSSPTWDEVRLEVSADRDDLTGYTATVEGCGAAEGWHVGELPGVLQFLAVTGASCRVHVLGQGVLDAPTRRIVLQVPDAREVRLLEREVPPQEDVERNVARLVAGDVEQARRLHALLPETYRAGMRDRLDRYDAVLADPDLPAPIRARIEGWQVTLARLLR